jgi:hypothetical protein
MKRCLFIGGPIDGQRRECDEERPTIGVPEWLGESKFAGALKIGDAKTKAYSTTTYLRGEIRDAFGKAHLVYYHESIMSAERCVVHELLDGYVSAKDRERLRWAINDRSK